MVLQYKKHTWHTEFATLILSLHTIGSLIKKPFTSFSLSPWLWYKTCLLLHASHQTTSHHHHHCPFEHRKRCSVPAKDHQKLATNSPTHIHIHSHTLLNKLWHNIYPPQTLSSRASPPFHLRPHHHLQQQQPTRQFRLPLTKYYKLCPFADWWTGDWLLLS